MANFYEDNQDLQFYVEKEIKWDEIVRVVEFDFKALDSFTSIEEAKEFYKDILREVGKVSAEEIAPVSKILDEKELEFKNGEVYAPKEFNQIFERFKEMGLYGMSIPRELGGMNCPFILYFINAEMIARGDSSVMNHYGFHTGIALALLKYSIQEGTTKFQVEPPRLIETRFYKEIQEIVEGRAWGSMDITEPSAGSDMGAIRTYAEQDEKGQWYLTGQKLFITSGHGKHHIVIAKTEFDGTNKFPYGLDRLSLFYVPAWEEDYQGNRKRNIEIIGLEKKLGIHASATVALNFDKSPAYLIGKRGQGFKLMLLLMNNARISVGFEALGLCEAAYRKAKEYAEQRESMGKTINNHEMIAEYLNDMYTDIQAIRALAMKSAYHEEMNQRLEILLLTLPKDYKKLNEIKNRQKYHAKKSRELTPLLKYFASEKSVEIARKAIQILGGYGYIKEYGVEKLLRDSIIFPIYEGTSQIQCLMVMKDSMMEIINNPKEFMQKYLNIRLKGLLNPDPKVRRVAKIETTTYHILIILLLRVTTDKFITLKDIPVERWIDVITSNWDPKKDFAQALLHAERLTKIMIEKAVCKILLEQGQRFPEREDLFYRYIEKAELRVDYYYKEILTLGDKILKDLANHLEKKVA
ncbi:MAG: acyl-CoA dehydrogenase family protein [Leptonema sp. (in: bacteria)]